MKKIILLILCLVVSFPAANLKKNVKAKTEELEVLKTYLDAARDSLQNEISGRWKEKQRYIQKREENKEYIVSLRERQEQIFNEYSRVKEEIFSKEKQADDATKRKEGSKEEWKYLQASMEEVFNKETDAANESFPTDVEKRKRKLENMRRDFIANRKPGIAFGHYLEYKLQNIETGGKIQLTKDKVLPEDGDIIPLTIARFGNVFGYGLSEDSRVFFLRQTGKLGLLKYKTEEITVQALKDHLFEKFPDWIQANKVSGPVVTDVLQNAQSSILISSKGSGLLARITGYVKGGGPVMIPLFILLVWALVLVVLKIMQFRKKRQTNRSLYEDVVKYLDNNEMEKAKAYVSTHKGVVARIVRKCLDHSQWERSSAEKAVKEILIEEIPDLNRYLNTLAVIAAGAPLLGLLGTVTGMINLFEVITHYGTGDPKIMAGGISEALITTQMGLTTAIPILLLHNFLRNKRDDLQASMEKSAIRILNRLWPRS